MGLLFPSSLCLCVSGLEVLEKMGIAVEDRIGRMGKAVETASE
jgi:hypothetical protein